MVVRRSFPSGVPYCNLFGVNSLFNSGGVSMQWWKVGGGWASPSSPNNKIPYCPDGHTCSLGESQRLVKFLSCFIIRPLHPFQYTVRIGLHSCTNFIWKLMCIFHVLLKHSFDFYVCTAWMFLIYIYIIFWTYLYAYCNYTFWTVTSSSFGSFSNTPKSRHNLTILTTACFTAAHFFWVSHHGLEKNCATIKAWQGLSR